ncbi:TIGR01777 family oxidoreductase [Nocardioides limicola]|uniref:TIGR01777 family oxidoreductase n=1 Tax=Nocardioides limicola TaxID=2803368 RepID=UPI00193B48FD|nr:TIGR01777 family oxidoreductase [Nocardioides sp. DJM-14]
MISLSRTAEFTQSLPDPPEVVFDWHRRPGALARLLPPWQPVRIGQESPDLRAGAAELVFPGGRTWVAQHLATEYADGRCFVDRLTSRPFVVPISWTHRHEFCAEGGGTRLIDQVRTTVPRRLLPAMFAFRQRQLADDLAAHRWASESPRLTVAITGASGLIGSALAPFLTTGGHRVIRLVRGAAAGEDQRRWDPRRPDPAALAGVDAVVHLAGHSIAGRFTDAHRDAVASSRIEPTRLLAEAAATAGVPVFVSASAIGYYGPDRDDEVLDESSSHGEGFLADLVAAWERGAVEGAGPGTRVVLVRTGVVQSPRGGALRLQRPLYAAGLGGPLAGGDQWLSWIGIDDLVDVYHRALIDSRLRGPVNAVTPHPLTQREYASTLGRVLHRPAVLPTPRLGPRLLLGREGEREVASASQRVAPRVLLEADHRFRFPHLEPALRHLLGGAGEEAQ